jgi:MoxR-like ATPase
MDATRGKLEALAANVGRALAGKAEVIRLAVIALLARGHILIEDVPGIGKTTLAHALARSIGGSFRRIQFTSDLLPSDILGVSVYEPTRGEFEFKPGPIFANILLADEINRTSPKTQSSLLEAMNEFQISVDHHTHPLPRPFIVLATQNPLEYQGTHPLPESQLDRFLLLLRIGYPEADAERRIVRGEGATGAPETLEPVLGMGELLALQAEAEAVRVDESLVGYLMALVQATRADERLALGVSPRGARALYRAARAAALLDGRAYCVPDDVKALAVPVLAHRLLPRERWAQAAAGRGGDAAEAILQDLVARTPVPA